MQNRRNALFHALESRFWEIIDSSGVAFLQQLWILV